MASLKKSSQINKFDGCAQNLFQVSLLRYIVHTYKKHTYVLFSCLMSHYHHNTLEYGLLSDFTNKEKFEYFLIHQGDQIFHYPDEILQKFKFFLNDYKIQIILLFVNCLRNITNIHLLWPASSPLVMYICNIPLPFYK